VPGDLNAGKLTKRAKPGRSPRSVTFADDFTDKPAKKKDIDPSRWWTAETSEACANAVTSLAAKIESSDWASNRYLMYVCARLMTGRSQPAGFGYSMTRRSGRAAQSMVSATWAPPALNCVATAADVFHQKIFKNRPWLQFLPTVKGSWQVRQQCKLRSQFVDAAFDQLNVWDKTSLAGTDCMQYPSSYIKVGSTVAGSAKKLAVERVLCSEILLTAEQAGSWTSLRSCLQRTFIAKEDLIAEFATGENAEQITAAIRNCPGVFPGFYSSSGLNYSEIAALVEGWRLPHPDGKPGRHVLCVGDLALVDEEWTRESLPFAKLDFTPLSNEQMGQSMTEQMLPLQRSIDRLSACIDETEQRWSWPRYFVEKSSHVDEDQFGSDFVEYSGTKPEKDATNSIPPELYASLESRIQKVFNRVGISQNSSAGEKQEGLSSGLALLAWSQIDDSRHIDLAQRYEKFIVDIGELILEECKDIKPTFVVDGKQSIQWEDVDADRNTYKTTCFPMSRLPQTPSARYEMINTWYQDGTISRSDKLRAESMPDLRPFTDAITASGDWVENTLDKIVNTGKFIAPIPYIDVDAAMVTAQARFVYENNHGLEEQRQRQLNKFIQALKEMPKPTGQNAPALAPGQPPAPQQALAMGGQPGQPPSGQQMPQVQPGQAAGGPAGAPGMQQQ